MSALVLILRTIAVLAFAAPALLIVRGRQEKPQTSARQNGAPRAPVVANFAAFGVFFASLLIFPGGAEASAALPLALAGCVVAIAGAALVLRSRAALGRAWSLLAKANDSIGLVTTGPYRRVRHPLYLGLVLLALGQAVAFSNWPAFLVVLVAIVPTFAWRARTEETLLSQVFGARYALYRQQTKMIIPHLL